MKAVIQKSSALNGALRIPADKSVCHRAVLASAIAEGATRIEPWPSADDCQRTLKLVQALGAKAQQEGEALIIEGCARHFHPPSGILDCHESGTTLRLAAGLLAGQSFVSVLSASPSLVKRPMQRITEPLSLMGAVIKGKTGAAAGEVYPPLTIEGRRPLRAIRYALPVASAQVKSAILLAGLFADGPTEIVEGQPTRDHTERIFQAFGHPVTKQGSTITIEPGKLVSPGKLILPGDISSAAFFLVAASIVPGSRISLSSVSLNPTRTGLLPLLKRMGASIAIDPDADQAWEARGTVTVKSAPLSAITVEPSETPGVIDELPILMVAAAVARGVSVFRGVGELRVKETDRVQSMVEGLGRMGVPIRMPAEDVLEIIGGNPLKGAAVESAGDHRTAMSLAIAALAAQGSTTIAGAESVTKSFPEFFRFLGTIARPPTVKIVDKP